jgi:hypothetical protein
LIGVLLVAAGCQGRQPPVPESFTVRLERGPCRGNCPEYSLTIAADGAVRYDGLRHVATAGAAIGTVPRDSAVALMREVEALGFFRLPDRYDAGDPACGPYIADLPAVVIAVRRGDVEKKVAYDPGCAAAPPGLGVLAARMDTMARITRWTLP